MRTADGQTVAYADYGQAHHTASIVPGAQLRTIPDLRHFSIVKQVVPAILAVTEVGG